MKVLFVGQNPSKENLDLNVPFVGTKSHKVLNRWAFIIGAHSYNMINCSNEIYFKPNKKNIHSTAEYFTVLKFYLKYDKIIALGNIAAKVLTKANIEHFKLPHPSGLNRKLNDKKWLRKQLKEAKKYVHA